MNFWSAIFRSVASARTGAYDARTNNATSTPIARMGDDHTPKAQVSAQSSPGHLPVDGRRSIGLHFAGGGAGFSALPPPGGMSALSFLSGFLSGGFLIGGLVLIGGGFFFTTTGGAGCLTGGLALPASSIPVMSISCPLPAVGNVFALPLPLSLTIGSGALMSTGLGSAGLGSTGLTSTGLGSLIGSITASF